MTCSDLIKELIEKLEKLVAENALLKAEIKKLKGE